MSVTFCGWTGKVLKYKTICGYCAKFERHVNSHHCDNQYYHNSSLHLVNILTLKCVRNLTYLIKIFWYIVRCLLVCYFCGYACSRIIGLYVSIVFVMSTLVRGAFTGISNKIMFDDMPNVDRILQVTKLVVATVNTNIRNRQNRLSFTLFSFSPYLLDIKKSSRENLS